MPIQWSFDPSDFKAESFGIIPEGDHRVRIRDAEETKSKAGNDMIKLTLDVSGHKGALWYYIVFNPSNPQMTNRQLGGVFSSFGITPGDLNVANWIGRVGACRVKHEMYNGEKQAKVHYFISQEKQKSLPPWADMSGVSSAAPSGFRSFVDAMPPEDYPFAD